MKVLPTPINGLIEVHPDFRSDVRGHFFEAWQAARYQDSGLPERFSQCNVSCSSMGVLRGLHLQHPNGQAKLVTAVYGTIYDVAVDVRRGSPSFGKWYGIELSGITGHQLCIPEGFAHGFMALTDPAVMMYLTTTVYDPATEIVVRWDDPELQIRWPMPPRELSPRDASAPPLAAVAARLPIFQG